MDALRNQILERRVIEQIVAEAKVSSVKGGSILKAEPQPDAIEQPLVAPVSQVLPEAKYEEQPEDGSQDKTVKPT